jgi:group I intron endonuclease
MSKTGFIYKITSPSGKFYIGRTINMKKRMYQHFKVSLISREVLKYGKNNMNVEILHTVPLNTQTTLKDDCGCARDIDKYDYTTLIDIEKGFINHFSNKNMLNILDNPLWKDQIIS